MADAPEDGSTGGRANGFRTRRTNRTRGCGRFTTPQGAGASGKCPAGPRQLLSFARALAHGADVLALDEATSSIDRETEALVQQGIRTLMEGRTALAIAHRLSTIRDVDRIYVLEHGRVAEVGSHDELLTRGGLYARLYHLQYAPQEPAPAAAAAAL